MNLVKELEKNKKSQYSKIKSDEIIKNANQLLLESHSRDIEILKELELDHEIKYENKLKEDIYRTEAHEKIYKKKSFTGKQIKDLCNKYYLKLLPINYYNGKIPSELPRIIENFAKDNDIIVSKYVFFILAPVEQFKNIKHVPINQDPILFYREKSSNTWDERFASIEDTFVQVYNWGNDFSYFRRFKKLFNTTSNSDSSNPLIFSILTFLTLITGVLFMLPFSILANIFGVFLISLSFYVFNEILNAKDFWVIDRRWNENII